VHSHEIIIRNGGIKDAVQIADIGYRAFASAFMNSKNAKEVKAYLNQAYVTPSILERMENPDIQYLVCESSGDLIGFAEVHRSPAEESGEEDGLMLDRLYIEPDRIGQGIGHALLIAFEDLARKEGLGFCWLKVLRPNTRGVEFYTKHGYGVFGESPGKFEADAEIDYWMGKYLSGSSALPHTERLER